MSRNVDQNILARKGENGVRPDAGPQNSILPAEEEEKGETTVYLCYNASFADETA